MTLVRQPPVQTFDLAPRSILRRAQNCVVILAGIELVQLRLILESGLPICKNLFRHNCREIYYAKLAQLKEPFWNVCTIHAGR